MACAEPREARTSRWNTFTRHLHIALGSPPLPFLPPLPRPQAAARTRQHRAQDLTQDGPTKPPCHFLPLCFLLGISSLSSSKESDLCCTVTAHPKPHQEATFQKEELPSVFVAKCSEAKPETVRVQEAMSTGTGDADPHQGLGL